MIKLIVGLGNPGARFEGTRHNVGIEAVRVWVEQVVAAGWHVSPWREDAKMPAELVEIRSDHKQLWLLFPLTFMNESGRAVVAFCKNRAITPEEIVVVHDELGLPLGEVRWKDGGSAAGHNGVRSVQEHMKSQDMRRLRLGIGRPQGEMSVEKFVLQKFLPEEQKQVEEMLTRAGEELSTLYL